MRVQVIGTGYIDYSYYYNCCF